MAKHGEVESSADPDGPVPDEAEAESPTAADTSASDTPGGRKVWLYRVASAILGIASLAAIALGLITWSAHHREVDDRAYQNRVVRTAANWASVLINLNAGNVDAGMARLRGKTAGPFNAEFESFMQPYRAGIQKIQSRINGRIDSVAIESVHHDLGAPAGAEPPQPMPPPPSAATRTDTVLVVATSVFQNEGKPETLRWNLQVNVSDVGGTLLISGLTSFR
ncbi:hypothetical protein [Mycobacterium sp.]|uniref:hypothetical protein n=1 Tax=Mycobacterium sp. TaxID=1785 RepID=UPI00126AF4DE|nr:hypothetical protein [Mycobacterium sp.]KAA8967507.1 MAG: hypothetical protein F6Q13_06015 [Mycobacterium sp.]